MNSALLRFAVGLSLIASCLAGYAVYRIHGPAMKFGFVNSQKLMTGFKPAYEVEKELLADNDKFKKGLRVLEDSLKDFMDTMTVRFDKADPASKNRMQNQLAAKNQEINNLQRAHARKMDEQRQIKMQTVFDKINVFMGEYGKKNGYAMIFGTVQGGNILYGEGTSSDITQDVIDALNERYK